MTPSEISGERWSRMWDLFEAALEQPEGQREQFLEQACPDDPELRSEVVSLLAADREAPPSFVKPDLLSDVQAQLDPQSWVGRKIGRYLLTRVLGEGGMGVVYEARQDQPVTRQVALKVIKHGLGSRDVLARFETERQAMALLRHPGIATIYDAGLTEDNRPFFVMEAVEGSNLMEFAARENLSVKARISLFLKICEAMTHAHQKGILHRDLKPANVLVASIEGGLQPKIIDFGVAKSLRGRLAARTLYTTAGQLIGTPEYMSPEQADLANLDIDTRTDIYALGVLLYELLTGVLPFDREWLHQQTYREIERVLREVDPPTPSRRLSQLDGEVDSKLVEVNRSSVIRELVGDLDWIVMKCLEKDRHRRYDSAEELAADLRRAMSHQPVLAGPPSLRYRASKFVKRNRLIVAASALVLVSLVAGLIGTTRMAVIAGQQSESAALARDEAERQARRAEKVNRFLLEMLSAPDPWAAGSERRDWGRDVKVVEVLDSATDNLDQDSGLAAQVEAGIRYTLGSTYLQLEQLEQAERQLDRAEQLYRGLPTEAGLYAVLLDRAVLTERRGELAAAELLYRDVVAGREELLGADHQQTLSASVGLGSLMVNSGKIDEARELLAPLVERARSSLGAKHPVTLAAIHNLGGALAISGDPDEAKSVIREAWDGRREIFGEDHPFALDSRNLLATVHFRLGELEAARRGFAATLAAYEQRLGPNNQRTLEPLNNLAAVLVRAGRLSEARDAFEKIVQRLGEISPDHPNRFVARANLAVVIRLDGDIATAERRFSVLTKEAVEVLGSEHHSVARFHRGWGVTLVSLEEYDRAERALLEAHRIFASTLANDHVDMVRTRSELVALYEAWDRSEELEKWQSKPTESGQ